MPKNHIETEIMENHQEYFETLKTLRLPDLQNEFHKIIGEPTRSPNKTHLMRRIRETLEARQKPHEVGTSAAQTSSKTDHQETNSTTLPQAANTSDQDTKSEPPSNKETASTDAPDQNDALSSTNRCIEMLRASLSESGVQDEPEQPSEKTSSSNGQKLTEYSVQELRSRYVEVVGRQTNSQHRGYLIWKIRQAEKGCIPVGPIQRKSSDSNPQDFKVLPLRMPTHIVVQLDEARVRLGLQSRMALFRQSLHAFLSHAGEHEVAALFGPVSKAPTTTEK